MIQIDPESYLKTVCPACDAKFDGSRFMAGKADCGYCEGRGYIILPNVMVLWPSQIPLPQSKVLPLLYETPTDAATSTAQTFKLQTEPL